MYIIRVVSLYAFYQALYREINKFSGKIKLKHHEDVIYQIHHKWWNYLSSLFREKYTHENSEIKQNYKRFTFLKMKLFCNSTLIAFLFNFIPFVVFKSRDEEQDVYYSLREIKSNK